MEEYDDLVPTPDNDGKLELTYRGWNLVDECVWTMGRELLVLDVSYNSITEFPPEFGDLMLLRELNCACNKIKEFPKQIGKLKNLKIIKANGNKLTRLPDEIGDCEKLEIMILGENLLQTVPARLSQLKHLEELILVNNKLNYFPPTLCLNPKLKNIDLLNNPGLKHMIPIKLQGNHEFIMWMCKKWYHHDEEAALVRICNKEYEGLLDISKDGVLELIQEVEKLHQDKRILADLMPQGIDRQCLRCFSTIKQCTIM
mmetsp:Transcript_5100/g.6462  ORF Transcript_5100/g.6462 Transcript_5100/m.6462 type:complete len:257 (+) Transcript_5100:65-835(+)